MSLTRRDFVKLCSGTVAGLGVSQLFHPELLMAMKEGMAKHPVIWIQGQGCTGCSVSILNSVNPSIKKVLLDIISMEYHPTIMASEGQTAMEHMYAVAEKYKGKFFLAVEGAVPMAADGKYCVIGEMHGADGKVKEITMLDAVTELGAMSGGVLALGTCAAYGGIPAAEGNVTEATGVGAVFEKKGIKTPVVNIPGCPPHPDWMVGSIAYVLTQGGLPELDGDGRPTLFFGENIHENCPSMSRSLPRPSHPKGVGTNSVARDQAPMPTASNVVGTAVLTGVSKTPCVSDVWNPPSPTACHPFTSLNSQSFAT